MVGRGRKKAEIQCSVLFGVSECVSVCVFLQQFRAFSPRPNRLRCLCIYDAPSCVAARRACLLFCCSLAAVLLRLCCRRYSMIRKRLNGGSTVRRARHRSFAARGKDRTRSTCPVCLQLRTIAHRLGGVPRVSLRARPAEVDKKRKSIPGVYSRGGGGGGGAHSFGACVQ